MVKFVVKYFSGFKKGSVLVMAQDEAVARRMFLEKFPRLRDYNILNVRETALNIFPLEG